jgi:prepilin-type processing-associated H-X9-DG protein
MHPTPVVPKRDAWLITHTAGLLRPGEVLYGALSVKLDPLAPETIPKRHRRPKPEAEQKARFRGWERIFIPVAAVMWVCSIPGGLLEAGAHHTWRGLRRIFRGRVWEGGWESAAGWFAVTTRTGTSDIPGYDNERLALAFTDQRLLLLSDPAMPDQHAAELLGEVPRGQYALRREPPPPRHKGRADIAFADGSWLALKADDLREGPLLGRLLSAG